MIPLIDLQRQYRSIAHEIDGAIRAVIDHAQFVQGPELDEFEREFASYLGARLCVGVGTGTAALKLALQAVGIKHGDEVILPANTFIATAFAVTACGATPVFVDVDPETLLVTAEHVAPAITRRTKAVIPVHLFGQMVDMDPLLALARSANIAVIEDAAQAHGARYGARKAGTLGDAGCFSFYPTKNLGAFGSGGAVVTSREDIARSVRLGSWLGQDRARRYVHEAVGDNSALDTLQAAVLRVKLRHLDEWNDRRRECARLYRQLLDGAANVELVKERSSESHVYHLFVALVEERDAVVELLAAAGICTSIHYPLPLHLQPAFSGLGLRAGSFPVSERAAARMISLPMFAELSVDELTTVAATLRAAAARGLEHSRS